MIIPNQRAANPGREVFAYFLKLGLLGFGGPLALISSMHRDLVETRKWMPEDAYARTFALIKAMPGPVAFQTAVFLGRHRAGWRGGCLAAIGLIAPAFFLMLGFGVFYDELRNTRFGPAVLAGMQAASLGVILATLKSLGFAHRKKSIFWILAAAAFAISAQAPAFEPLVIVLSGAFTALLFTWKNKEGAGLPRWLRNLNLALVPPSWQMFFFGNTEAIATLSVHPSFATLIWTCFKSGAFVFGSGLAIVPLMENDFVTNLGWLSHREFMDALAFGQVTPGPIIISAAFIGFKTLGFLGALTATLAVFSAPFFHMMTWFPHFNERLARLPWIAAFLSGAVAAVVGSILATTLQLIVALEYKTVTAPLLGAALLASLFSRIPVWATIPAGGLMATLLI